MRWTGTVVETNVKWRSPVPCKEVITSRVIMHLSGFALCVFVCLDVSGCECACVRLLVGLFTFGCMFATVLGHYCTFACVCVKTWSN